MAIDWTKYSVFRGLEIEKITDWMNPDRYEEEYYGTGEVVRMQNSRIDGVIFLTEGRICCQVTGRYARGRTDCLTAPALICPGLVYSFDNKLPFTVEAETPVTIVSIPKPEWTRIMAAETKVMENFMALLSDSRKSVTDSLLYMRVKTIKGKFATYLLEQCGGKEMTVRMKKTQRELSELFGVSRPSLARAICEMSQEGCIHADRKNITVVYPEKLRQYVREK